MPRTESRNWFKSSYSDNGGNCIEVSTDHTAVRDSKPPSRPGHAHLPRHLRRLRGRRQDRRVRRRLGRFVNSS
ncbi:DUF397 domain-containing protein [Streptomyces sp. NPDC015184]|uniref:DUF397 domain-containing protein n=1 Tax=Streptomyces sp. NPDC015184 TaxID=3364946 RepID=UPI003702E797